MMCCETCIWFHEDTCECPSSRFFAEWVPRFFLCPYFDANESMQIDDLPIFFPVVDTRRPRPSIDYLPDLLRLVPFLIAAILAVVWGVLLFSLLGWMK
jgi:hypothetical protein